MRHIFAKSRLSLHFFIILLVFPTICFSQSDNQTELKIISVLQSSFLQGFSKRLSGEMINYHSANEYVHSALLTRATDGTMNIEWQTQAVPSGTKEKFVTFVWLYGISTNLGSYRFDMFINNEKWFTFSNPKDSTQKIMTCGGRNGSSLTLYATMADVFGDLFGYAILRIPVASFKKGEALTLRVAGEAAKNNSWFMTFQHELKTLVLVEALPLLVKENGASSQIIKTTIDHYKKPANASIAISTGVKKKFTLQYGANSFMLPVPAVSSEKAIKVLVTENNKIIHQETITLKPVMKRSFYLLPHSHTDIGYSARQVKVEQDHMRYIDEAIDLAQKTVSFPPEAQFKWNIEVMWPLESYLNRANDQQKKRFIDAVNKGWIGLNGLYANILTGMCRPEELIQATEYARHITNQFGVPVTSAMITDIPSYTSSTVTALSLGGIKYFSSGPNYMPTLPDYGDRIGYALKAWGDKPFYWQTKTGHSVLFWMAGHGYSWFHGLNMGKLSKAGLSSIYDYLIELDKTKYPYEMVQVRYTVGGDNGPPDPDLADFVRNWNERYESPKFIISTTEKMFEEFERRYGSIIPVYQGDLTPHWEDGAVSTAREQAMNRESAEKLSQTEVLYSLFKPFLYKPDDFYSAWRKIVLWDEHTWGAANSVSEPDSPDAKSQWEYKQKFVLDGVNEVNSLMNNITVDRVSTGLPCTALDIVNTNSWMRSDLVIIPTYIRLKGDRVKDRNENVLPSQRLSTGELAVLVKDVPPLSAKTIFFEKVDAQKTKSELKVDLHSIRNGFVKLSIDQRTGAIASLQWKVHSGDFVDGKKGAGLNQYFYVPGKDPKTAVTDNHVAITVKENGPLVTSLLIDSKPDGCNSLQREVRLINGFDRVDIINTIDKKMVREKEGVHFGFPFQVTNGVVRVDEGWDVIRPESDQLDGACKDYFSVQRWVDVSNKDYGVTLATVDAPLVEAGAITDETRNEHGTRNWRKSIAPAQNLYSYVMNNYWHTNYKADQEGIAIFRYSILPHERFDRAEATRFGLEQNQPLIIKPYTPYDNYMPPQISIEPSSVIVTSFKPSMDGKGWMMRLFNVGDAQANLSMKWNVFEPVIYYQSNLFEKELAGIKFPLKLDASGILTIKVVRK